MKVINFDFKLLLNIMITWLVLGWWGFTLGHIILSVGVMWGLPGARV